LLCQLPTLLHRQQGPNPGHSSRRPFERLSGGKIIGYYLPTDFAGPTNEAYGLIEFQTLASYEQYRKALTDDAGHKQNAAELERSGAAIYMTRSILERVGDGEQN
jgi:NIPSNAP